MTRYSISVEPKIDKPHPAPNKPERNEFLVQLIMAGLDPKEVAHQLNISYPQVCLIFKAETGQTILEATEG